MKTRNLADIRYDDDEDEDEDDIDESIDNIVEHMLDNDCIHMIVKNDTYTVRITIET